MLHKWEGGFDEISEVRHEVEEIDVRRVLDAVIFVIFCDLLSSALGADKKSDLSTFYSVDDAITLLDSA